MFLNMQYYFAYLYGTDITIAVSVCCGTRFNKMAASDETSLISSEVECIGLGYLLFRYFWDIIFQPFQLLSLAKDH